MPLTGFLQSVQPNTVKGLAWFSTTSRLWQEGHPAHTDDETLS